LANLHNKGGEFNKSLTVTTNAKNNQSFRLSLSGNFIPLIELDPGNNLRLSATRDTGEIITVKTPKKELQFIDVTFKESGKDVDFRSIVPIKYSLVLTDSTKSGGAAGKDNPASDKKGQINGKKTVEKAGKAAGVKPMFLYIYKLRLNYVAASSTEQYGEFTFKTNIPEKPEIKLSGTLEAKSN
jgi:hypothetical protein